MGDTLSIAVEIEPVMQQMQSRLADGRYEFDDDLPFMPLVVNALQYLIPCKTLLMRINDTHRNWTRRVTACHTPDHLIDPIISTLTPCINCLKCGLRVI